MTINKAIEIKNALYGSGYKLTVSVYRPVIKQWDDTYFGTIEIDPEFMSAFIDGEYITVKSFDDLYISIDPIKED